MATKTTMDTDMVNINQETLFNKVEFPYVVPVEDLKHTHPCIKSLCCPRKIPNVQLARRLKIFIENWKILKNDTEILSLVKGYTISFHEIPQQKNIPNSPKVSQKEKILVQKEIYEMLNKRAIVETPNHLEGELISNLFLVEKKDGRTRPVINLKHLNQFISYQHFKMEGLHCLRNILKKGDCKLDLKDSYFSVLLNSASRKFVRCLWSGKLYEFLCLCFELGPAPSIFTKLLKIPVSLLRRLDILIIIYLEDMLLIGHTIEETLVTRDTVIFLLLPSSVLTPTQRVEFLGVTVDSLINKSVRRGERPK